MVYSGNISNLNSHLQHCLRVKQKINQSILPYFKGSKAKLPPRSRKSKELTKGLITFIVLMI